ncbi:peptidoglycan-binding protein [Streptomyces sp. HUAS MG47]|uniref:peptidoglycan-binding protein n=1 Tax=Streptomyces solicamelliae TaxID=3231716 RepID=UPI0038779B96
MAESEQGVRAVGLMRRRRWIVIVAAGAVLASGAGLAAARMVKSPAQAALDSAAPPPSVITAGVEYRVLADSVILRGSVTAEQSIDVAPTGGTSEGSAPVVTKLLAAVGSQLTAGQVLAEVSGRPVFVLQGRLPIYRDLKPDMEGDDVAQLQTALRQVGHGVGTDRKGHFGVGTKAALTGFYSRIGYDPLPARAEGADEVETAEAAVTEAERALEDAQVTPQDAHVQKESPKEAIPTSKNVKRAREDLRKARERLAESKAKAGPMLPASEVVLLSGFPARVDSLTAKVGSAVSGKILTVSAGALVVNGYLQQHQKGLVRPGQQVQILSEVTGTTAPATVTSVSETIQQEQSVTADGQPDGPSTPNGYLLVVKPTKELPSELAGQDVRLTVQAASTKGKALVVPVSAITAGVDGRTSVTVLTEAGAERKVPVTTGTTGDGYVEVRPQSGHRLAEGERVIVGIRNSAMRQGQPL